MKEKKKGKKDRARKNERRRKEERRERKKRKEIVLEKDRHVSVSMFYHVNIARSTKEARIFYLSGEHI